MRTPTGSQKHHQVRLPSLLRPIQEGRVPPFQGSCCGGTSALLASTQASGLCSGPPPRCRSHAVQTRRPSIHPEDLPRQRFARDVDRPRRSRRRQDLLHTPLDLLITTRSTILGPLGSSSSQHRPKLWPPDLFCPNLFRHKFDQIQFKKPT